MARLACLWALAAAAAVSTASGAGCASDAYCAAQPGCDQPDLVTCLESVCYTGTADARCDGRDCGFDLGDGGWCCDGRRDVSCGDFDEECDIETSGDRSSSPSGTTNHGAGNGWCYSSLDDHVGCAASPGDCWAMCEDEYGDGLVAIDWWDDGGCYCQNAVSYTHLTLPTKA